MKPGAWQRLRKRGDMSVAVAKEAGRNRVEIAAESAAQS
jgi:hypothetical protein